MTSTSVSGNSPARSRISTGIVTCPLAVIRIDPTPPALAPPAPLGGELASITLTSKNPTPSFQLSGHGQDHNTTTAWARGHGVLVCRARVPVTTAPERSG